MALRHAREDALRAVGALALVAVELILPLLVVPAVPEVVACLVYLHAVMIFHDASERVLDLMQVLVGITVHLGVAVVAEVG